MDVLSGADKYSGGAYKDKKTKEKVISATFKDSDGKKVTGAKIGKDFVTFSKKIFGIFTRTNK